MVSPPNVPNVSPSIQQAFNQLADSVNAALGQGGGSPTLIFRPGAPSTQVNVYDTWAALMAALAAVPNASDACVQIDDSLAPPSIPAGVWDMRGAPMQGPFTSTNTVTCDLEDGCVLQNLFRVRNFLTLNCKSTTVPALTLVGGVGLLLEVASTIQNDPASTVPAILVPANNTSIIACLTGGRVGNGTACAQVDLNSGLIILLDLMAGLADNSVVGAGSLIVLLTSPSATSFSSWPPVQPGIFGFLASSIQYAYLIGFSPPGLNPGNWLNAPPLDVNAAVERMADLLFALNGGNPIP